ncbi:MAG TPA: hypothetical protein VFN56_04155 [Candidatus Saccharimonadales bacterium]|nr:hypothetical protein [Candidatus Saccharimonadales bacterium]
MQNRFKQLTILLAPSWLSGLVVVAASGIVTIGTIVLSNYQGSTLQQQLFEARAGQSTASVLGIQTITDNLAQNRIVNNLPLFLFWAGLGVIVYLFVVAIWNSISTAAKLREEMNYVHASRHALMLQEAQHTIFRLIVLGVWLIYVRVFLRALLPYGLAAAHTAVHLSVRTVGYGLLSFVVIALALHVHVILLRLVLLRLRAVGAVTSDYQSMHQA